MKRCLAPLAVCWLIAASPSAAAPSVTKVGSATFSAGNLSQLAIPLTVTPNGSPLVGFAVINGSATGVSVTDNGDGTPSCGNWIVDSSKGSAQTFVSFHCLSYDANLTSGKTVSVNWTSANAKASGGVLQVTGAAATFDSSGAYTTNSPGTEATITTDGPTTPAMHGTDEIAFGALSNVLDQSSNTFTPGSGWSALVINNTPTGSNVPSLYVAWQEITSGTVTYNGSFNTALTWYGDAFLYNVTAPAIACRHSLAATGSGC